MIERTCEFEREGAARSGIRIEGQRKDFIGRRDRTLVRDQRLAAVGVGRDVVDQRDSTRCQWRLRISAMIRDGNGRMLRIGCGERQCFRTVRAPCHAERLVVDLRIIVGIRRAIERVVANRSRMAGGRKHVLIDRPVPQRAVLKRIDGRTIVFKTDRAGNIGAGRGAIPVAVGQRHRRKQTAVREVNALIVASVIRMMQRHVLRNRQNPAVGIDAERKRRGVIGTVVIGIEATDNERSFDIKMNRLAFGRRQPGIHACG